MHEFSIKESISFGWNTFKARPWLFIGVELALFAISFIVGIPGRSTQYLPEGEKLILSIIFFLISTAVSFLIGMGKTSFYLKAHDSIANVSFRDLWHPRPFWKYVAVSLIAGLATIVGLILLIVPGIIIGIMVAFATYIVIDIEMGPIEAIKHSATLTKGRRWKLLKFGLALLGVNILGFIALIVGLLVSVPVSILAVVHVYRTLSTNPLPTEVPAPTV